MISFNDARQELKRIREEGLRDSERVVDIWTNCLCQYSYRLGDEKWTVYEQVYISALDCGNLFLADECFRMLKDQFPSSRRIKRYAAMRHEFMGLFSKAEDTYKRLLEEDDQDSQAMKRLITLHRTQGRYVEAIKQLNKYLELFCTDFEAWLELSELYLNEGDYKKAAFCMEELILSNPHNHLYHQRYAEIRYSEGSTESMDIARSYFSHALKLNPNNLRSLYGLLLSSSNCANNPKTSPKARKEAAELVTWAAGQISDRYGRGSCTEGSSHLGSGLVTLFKQLSLTGDAAQNGGSTSPKLA